MISIFSPSVRLSSLTMSVDQLVDVDALRLQGLASGEGQEAPRQIGAAQRRIERFAGEFVGLGIVLASSGRSRSRLPMMMPSRLLKSCAMPPVRLPIASIFCACAAAPRPARSRVSLQRCVRSHRSALAHAPEIPRLVVELRVRLGEPAVQPVRLDQHPRARSSRRGAVERGRHRSRDRSAPR